MSENPYLRNLVPHSAKRHEYIPEVGAYITISLPGEMIRATVERVSGDDGVVAKIASVPMGRGHTYRKDDIVPCRRIVDDLLKNEQWEIVSERELNLAEAAARFEQAEQARLEREKTEKMDSPDRPVSAGENPMPAPVPPASPPANPSPDMRDTIAEVFRGSTRSGTQ